MGYDLNSLTTEELGKLFPIIIADHNPEWKNLFSAEKQNILNRLDSKFVHSIEHIGSTSVPGLIAKPTIDILLEINESTDLELLKKKLQIINYQYIPKPENPPPHIMFAKGYSIEGITGQTYHLHVRYPGDWDEKVFRDFLIDNQDDAAEYADLKRKLVAEFKNDREKYTDSKTAFIHKTLHKARLK